MTSTTTTTTTSTSPTSVNRPDRLAAALERLIVTPEHAAYDEARQAWNLAIDQRPAAVVFPESVQDVANAVQFARRFGQRVAAQGTGHSAAPLGSLEDTVLIRTSRMRGVTIDPSRRIARVEAGVLWHEVAGAAAQHGLAALQGSSPDVGVVGYTLGGGLSFFSRKHGLAANSVCAIELVSADGEVMRADRNQEPDLFWALRGGGGSFGIVTAIELELLPIRELYAGLLWYPIERAGEALGAWRELTQRELPDELTTVGRILNLPPIEDIPEPVRGKSFAVIEAYHLGSPSQAEELLAPLRALGPVNDTIAMISPPALAHARLEPEHPVPAIGDGLTLDDLPVAAIDAFVQATGRDAPVPLVSVELRHLEGALGRSRAGHGALGSIQARYALFAVGMLPTPELETPLRASVQAVKGALTPWAATHRYLNFTESRQPVEMLWPPDVWARLREIKAAVDPDDVIRSNHPIPPAR